MSRLATLVADEELRAQLHAVRTPWSPRSLRVVGRELLFDQLRAQPAFTSPAEVNWRASRRCGRLYAYEQNTVRRHSLNLILGLARPDEPHLNDLMIRCGELLTLLAQRDSCQLTIFASFCRQTLCFPNNLGGYGEHKALLRIEELVDNYHPEPTPTAKMTARHKLTTVPARSLRGSTTAKAALILPRLAHTSSININTVLQRARKTLNAPESIIILPSRTCSSLNLELLKTFAAKAPLHLVFAGELNTEAEHINYGILSQLYHCQMLTSETSLNDFLQNFCKI